MPTGYTADILDGKITTVQEFAATCSRAFTFHQRGDGMDGTLRLPERRDAYYKTQLVEYMTELKEWDEADEEARYGMWSDYYNKKDAARTEAADKALKNHRLLSAMLRQVKEIDVPESHSEFKKFMIEQIMKTIRSDGDLTTITGSEYYRPQGYVEWCEPRRGYILSALKDTAERLRAQEDNYQTSCEWINTLAQIYGLDVKS